MNRRARLLLTLLASTVASALAGCASSTPTAPASAAAAATPPATAPATAPAAPLLGAKPWTAEELAKRYMRFDGYPLELALDEHIYFSKEASSGGSGFAGGGCGCN